MKIIEDTRTEHKLLKFYIKHCCHPKVSLIIEDGRRVLGLWKNPQGWWTWTLTVFLDHVKIHFRFCLLTLISYLLKKKKKNSLEGLSNERAHLKHTLVVPAARPASTSAGWPQGSSQTLGLIRGFTEYYFCLLKIGILGNTQSRCLISHTWEYTVKVSYFTYLGIHSRGVLFHILGNTQSRCLISFRFVNIVLFFFF